MRARKKGNADVSLCAQDILAEYFIDVSPWETEAENFWFWKNGEVS